MSVGGVLLAAGAGRRFGGPKALVVLDGELLVERGVRLFRAGGCEPVVAVLGAGADEVRAQACLDADLVFNADWSQGMSTSLAAGLAALAGRCSAAVVALADQPNVQPQVIARLREAWIAGAVAAVATYAGAPRNPVLLDAGVWDEALAAAHGDEGARAWLRANEERVTAVACDDVGSPFDLDTPEDLSRLREEHLCS